MGGDNAKALARRPASFSSGGWVWAMAGAVFVVCVTLVVFQARQMARTEQTLQAIRQLRIARLDLAKGFLHLAEADEPGSPFTRGQGLALLRQATDRLEGDARDEKKTAEAVAGLLEPVRALRARLDDWPADGMRRPEFAAELRMLFHAVEREADAMDARLQARLREMSAGNRREFVAVAAGAAVLLSLFCGVALVMQRRSAALARESREAEERFATVVENLGEGLVLANEDGRLLHWNRAALAMHGFADIAQWQQQLADMEKLFTLETPEGEVLPYELWPLPRLLRGETVRGLELRLRRVGSDWERLFSYGGGMARAEDGSRFAFLTIGDVSARSIAERALRDLNAELEKRVERRTLELEAKNHELEMFTYSVSHDLKAPLRGIDGYSRLLLEDYSERLDAEGRRFLSAVRQASAHMGQLIDDLLAYSRLERRATHAAAVKPKAIVRSLLDAMAGEIEERGVVVREDIPEELELRADPQAFTMALRNLIDNALKFTRAIKHPVIEIGARVEEADCVLWVRDNGIGFDMRFIDRIFEIFQRLHRIEDYPGTGIGLAIVRKAMERMGGRAWAESEPDRGATFFLQLPLHHS